MLKRKSGNCLESETGSSGVCVCRGMFSNSISCCNMIVIMHVCIFFRMCLMISVYQIGICVCVCARRDMYLDARAVSTFIRQIK